VAAAPVLPLVWETPYASGVAPKRQKKKKKKKSHSLNSSGMTAVSKTCFSSQPIPGSYKKVLRIFQSLVL